MLDIRFELSHFRDRTVPEDKTQEMTVDVERRKCHWGRES